MARTFQAKIEPSRGWSCVQIPPEVSEILGAKGRTAVTLTINGTPFRTSLFPNSDGTHFMLINKAMQKAANVKLFDTPTFTVEADTQPRTLEAPADLAAALEASPIARQVFEGYSYSHRRAWLAYVEEAKKPETRQRHIDKVIKSLKELAAKKSAG
ncbi:MAG: YdeI/OmpD-associated family protein [Anaerolineaceae bacterium]|jgi:hypothetical protein